MTLLSTFQSVTQVLWNPEGGHQVRQPLLARLFTRAMQAHSIWQQRQRLLDLDPSQLDDIGLNRSEAEAEAARPVWDVPQMWRS